MMTLQPLTEAGLEHVLANLAPEDRAELAAAGQAPSVFRDAMHASPITGQVELDGEPVAIFGCTTGPGYGIPWMVATLAFRRHPRQSMAVSNEGVARMKSAFPVLRNLVHIRHGYAMRWLPRLGFVIDDQPAGPGGVFRQFEWSDPCATQR